MNSVANVDIKMTASMQSHTELMTALLAKTLAPPLFDRMQAAEPSAMLDSSIDDAQDPG